MYSFVIIKSNKDEQLIQILLASTFCLVNIQKVSSNLKSTFNNFSTNRMASAFREMHSLKFAQSTIYQLQVRQLHMLVPLNARLAMLNLTGFEEDDAVAESSIEETEDMDTL